jgi:hypothetical protein
MHGWNELSATDTLLVDISNADEFKLYTMFTHKSQTNPFRRDSNYEMKPSNENYETVNTVNPNFNREDIPFEESMSFNCEIKKAEVVKSDFKFNLEIDQNIPTHENVDGNRCSYANDLVVPNQKQNIPVICEMDSIEENMKIR